MGRGRHRDPPDPAAGQGGTVCPDAGFRPLAHEFAEDLELSARADVDEAHLVRNGGDKLAPAPGKVGGRATLPGLERRQQQQTSLIQGTLPFRRQAQAGQASRRADDPRLLAPQQEQNNASFSRRRISESPSAAR